MSILATKDTVVLVQGITGNEGAKMTRQMLIYGTKVACGVTPGKGDQRIEGRPVFNSVKEALKSFGEVNTALVSVPPGGVRDAVMESLLAGIKLIVVLTEKVPLHHTSWILAWAKRFQAKIVGPSSLGMISPGEAKLGLIGGEKPEEVFTSGAVGLISRSGGMISEIARILKSEDIGFSTAVAIGGDVLVGTGFKDLYNEFVKDVKTRAVVIYGEVGGLYEHELARAIKNSDNPKPVVALIAGRFAEGLGEGVRLGHAGALIEKGRGSWHGKTSALRTAGALIAEYPEDIPRLLKNIL